MMVGTLRLLYLACSNHYEIRTEAQVLFARLRSFGMNIKKYNIADLKTDIRAILKGRYPFMYVVLIKTKYLCTSVI